MLARLLFLFCALFVARPGFAATCDAEDFVTRVSGDSQCLVMRQFGDVRPDVLLVWLHGDVSAGGPANYHFAIAQKSVSAFASARVLAVALVRPGYPDGSGNESSVAAAHGGRSDHYTKENVGEVATAIERLRDRYQARSVIVIGHSGGAATTAIALGMKPKLIDAAILVSCPCDLVAWRQGRRAWPASENPIAWVGQIAPSARVIALTGERDDNTSPRLAGDYVEALKARQIEAEFRLLGNESHNSAFRSAELTQALGELLRQHGAQIE